MPLYRIIGEHLVGDDEFALKGEAITRALLAKDAGAAAHPTIMLGGDRPLSFNVGLPSTSTPFPAIGYGLPLTIDIRLVYPGNVRWTGFMSGGDTAVVSGVKNWSVFDATARALNLVAHKPASYQPLPGPSALNPGTGIVCYVPAVATEQLLVTFELICARSDDSLVATLQGAFTAAASIPLLVPYAGALLVAGQILNLGTDLIDAVTNGRNQWQRTETFNFGKSGEIAATAGLRAVTRENAGLERLTYRDGQLREADGSAYAGDEPYIIIGADGRPNPDLNEFTPAVASAELLKRFYAARTGTAGVLADLNDIVKLASDVKYRRSAEAMKAQVDGATGPAKADYQRRLDALVANIRDPMLRP